MRSGVPVSVLDQGTTLRLRSGQAFSRADKPFIFVIPSGLQPARICFSDFFSSLFSRAVTA